MVEERDDWIEDRPIKGSVNLIKVRGADGRKSEYIDAEVDFEWHGAD